MKNGQSVTRKTKMRYTSVKLKIEIEKASAPGDPGYVQPPDILLDGSRVEDIDWGGTRTLEILAGEHEITIASKAAEPIKAASNALQFTAGNEKELTIYCFLESLKWRCNTVDEDQDNRQGVNITAGVVYFIGGANIALGLLFKWMTTTASPIVIFEPRYGLTMEAIEYGYIGIGVLFLILAVLVQLKMRFALVLVMILVVLFLFGVVNNIKRPFSPASAMIGAVIVLLHLGLLLMMAQGLGSIKAIKKKRGQN